jgi:hypothetical protein
LGDRLPLQQKVKVQFMDKLGLRVPGESVADHDQDLLRELLKAIRGLRYGSITLIVHEGGLVEIQKTEKIRTGNVMSKDGKHA